MKKLSILIGSAAASLAVLSFAVAAHRNGVTVGASAPAFEATDAAGRKRSSSPTSRASTLFWSGPTSSAPM